MLQHAPMLADKLGKPEVKAITYATPPVVTMDVALAVAPFIITVVNNVSQGIGLLSF